jgi:hypothetical protein
MGAEKSYSIGGGSAAASPTAIISSQVVRPRMWISIALGCLDWDSQPE